MYNTSFERVILSSLIFEAELCVEKNELNPLIFLSAKDFYLPSHAMVFSVIHDLFNGGTPVDENFLLKELNSKSISDAENVILSILSANPASDLKPYLLEIKRMKTLRDIEHFRISLPSLYEEFSEPIEIIDSIKESIDSIANGNSHDLGITSAKNLLNKYLNQESIRRVKCNIKEFDEYFGGGFDEGGLVIYSGEPECGKTHISYSVAERASIGVKSGIISLEFGENDYAARLQGLQRNGILFNEDNLELNFNSHSLSLLITTLYQMAHRGCKLVVIDSLHKVIHSRLTNSTEIINDVANRIDEVCKITRMSIHLIALGSKDDYLNSRMGVLYSVTVPHLAKIFITITNNKETGERRLNIHKNKQTRGLNRIYANFLESGEILFNREISKAQKGLIKQRVSIKDIKKIPQN